MTIKDLSAQTGYSVGTISRVLNGHPNVSEKARAAILEAVRESGFELNANAKNLKQQHATSILVMVKGSSNELFRSLLEAIQGRLSKTRYPVSVEYLDEDDNEVLQALRLCREKKPLGILFLGGNTADFRTDFSRIDLPCVLVTRDASELSFGNLSSVSSDDRLAARRGLECLIRLGHRHIAVIGGNMELSDVSRLRYEGCMDAFQAADIVFDPKRDYMGVRFSYQDGYRATQALLSRGHWGHAGLTGQRPAGAGGCIRYGLRRAEIGGLSHSQPVQRGPECGGNGQGKRVHSAGSDRKRRRGPP